MLSNYLKIILRNFRRNLVYTLISILGLGIGIAGLIFAYLLFDYEARFDSFQRSTDDIYRVNTRKASNTVHEIWGVTPIPLGAEAAESVDGVLSFCRYGTSGFLVKYADNVFSENIYFADTNFFRLFDYKILTGDLISFKVKNTAVISHDLSKKYFGQQDATGKIITVYKNDTTSINYQVGAVLDEMPLNSSFQFDIILPYSNALDFYGLMESDWSVSIPTVTYLQLNTEADISQIDGWLQQFKVKNNEILDDWQIEEFYLTPFRDQKNEARKLFMAITWPGLPRSALYGSLFMNIMILVIVCINFTNTSIACTRNRIREIGVRKTFGSVKKQIIIQFLLENSMQCFIALLIGMDLAVKWVNWTNKLWPTKIYVDYLHDPGLMVFLILVLFAVIFLAGFYPSVYVAKFQPSQILRGKLKFHGTNALTRILLVWQFAFSVTSIFSGIALAKNARFQEKLDWGFDKDNVIIVPLRDRNQFTTYKNAISKIPEVSDIAGAIHNAGYSYTTCTFDLNGITHDCQMLEVGDNYLNTLGLELRKGRDFLINSGNDMRESVIVNEKFLQSFNIQSPLSETIRIENRQYFIIGVIKDYMPFGLYSPVQPAILKLVPNEESTLICVRGESSGIPVMFRKMQREWKALFPEKPFEGFFQNDSAANAARTNDSLVKEFILMAIIALLISSSGLYSMISLNVNKRMKEIGIRKVMGASIRQILYLINLQFVLILLISIVLGSVLGYFFMDVFLADIFIYHTPLGPVVFIMTILVIFLGALITAGRKVFLAACINPAKSLRYE